MLAVEGVSVSYGAIRAVRDVTLSVEEGEVVALLGANGAGKTTLLSAVAGLLQPTAGTISFEGEDVTAAPPEEMVRRGVSLTPEGRRVFADLTVEENLRLGGATQRDRDSLRSQLESMVELFPSLETRWRLQAGKLSGGEQQMLAIARSLMSNPRLLLLDEPSLGLAPVIVDLIFDLFGRLRDRGITVLLVEQNAHRALEVADRAYVMSTGQIGFDGTAAALYDSSRLMRTYLGLGDQVPGVIES